MKGSVGTGIGFVIAFIIGVFLNRYILSPSKPDNEPVQSQSPSPPWTGGKMNIRPITIDGDSCSYYEIWWGKDISDNNFKYQLLHSGNCPRHKAK